MCSMCLCVSKKVIQCALKAILGIVGVNIPLSIFPFLLSIGVKFMLVNMYQQQQQRNKNRSKNQTDETE